MAASVATSFATLGLPRVRAPGVAAAGGVEVGGAGGVDGGGHVGEQEAQPLVVDDLLAEGAALVGVVDGGVQRGLREAGGDGRDAQAPGVERGERDGQALALRRRSAGRSRARRRPSAR
jgi:hypothetical protein